MAEFRVWKKTGDDDEDVQPTLEDILLWAPKHMDSIHLLLGKFVLKFARVQLQWLTEVSDGDTLPKALCVNLRKRARAIGQDTCIFKRQTLRKYQAGIDRFLNGITF